MTTQTTQTHLRPYLISLAEASNPAHIGQKSANLARLQQQGLPVPQSWCLTTDAFHDFLAQGTLQPEIDLILANTQFSDATKARQIESLILTTGLPARLLNELSLHPFAVGAWAVRSSATAEDLADASFAGLYESYLNLTGHDAVMIAIRRVWASLWSDRALSYRRRQLIEAPSVAMALLIQEMVPARWSGVIFTRDPICPDSDTMVLEFCQGIGEDLVAGKISPQICRIDARGRNVNPPTPTTLPATLDNHAVKQLFRIARQVESIFDTPQDIEWAYTGEKFYLLQSRPITTHRRKTPVIASAQWTRANVGEILPEVVTPLTWSVFCATLLNQPEIALPVTLRSKVINRNAGRKMAGIKRVNGRVHVRVESLLTTFGYLPRVTLPILAQVFGVTTEVPAAALKRPRGLKVMLAQIIFTLDAWCGLPYLKIKTQRLTPLPAADKNRILTLIKWNANCFQLHLKATAYTIAAYAWMASWLRRWLPNQYEFLLPLVLNSQAAFQSAAQGTELWHLAAQLRLAPELCQCFLNGKNWAQVQNLIKNLIGGREFLHAWEQFLTQNGARATNEFELAQPRWREAPDFLFQVLQKYLRQQSSELKPVTAPAFCQSGTPEFLKNLRPGQRWAFKRLLAAYRRYAILRENLKYHLIEGFGQLRETFRAMGIELVHRHLLESTSDVFFLKSAEVLALVTGDAPARNLKPQIEQRKNQYHRWQELPNPVIAADRATASITTGTEYLHGIGCSPGKVTGKARVLFAAVEVERLEADEILIAPHVDPGWTPLFLNCRAVVTAVGGFLSHGATVAREYGVPAVFNVTNLLHHVHSGDWLEVDGAQGWVRLLPEQRTE
ncbi:hypothetical protein L0128_07405 [candidate division KSB1 bacterium]|nr:hypothetical protein [candidate division KSB1 bacterium]